jgi:hypothetical protein
MAPPLLFRDVRELATGKAHTVFRAPFHAPVGMV